jgi:hypothetical protein
MIYGTHVVLYSSDPAADRAFFRDVLECAFVTVRESMLVFAMPPAELAVHPIRDREGHELCLLCDDVKSFVAEMKAKKVVCSEIVEEVWGSTTELTLPSGGEITVYQPKHASPIAPPERR